MRIPCFSVFGAMFVFGATMAGALDPTVVDGVVNVTVDYSQQPWNVTVTNKSNQEIAYEMMGKVPRGLGVELWEEEIGIRLHAENLAKYLDVAGFPADLRELKPKQSVSFQLNPKSMSSMNKEQYETWERTESIGYYNCRVFFGVYASRMITVVPLAKHEKKDDEGVVASEPKP